jgi:hypothetical protein
MLWYYGFELGAIASWQYKFIFMVEFIILKKSDRKVKVARERSLNSKKLLET